jgi:hypothetical protein
VNSSEVNQQAEKRSVSIRPLKQFALEKLPLSSAARNEILSEPDNVSSDEYILLLRVCLRLMQFDNLSKSTKIEVLET